MPIYDYACSKCAAKSELNKRISDRDNTQSDGCPNCSLVGTLERVLSAPLIGYSTTIKGSYGNKIPDGFKDVLRKIDQKSPGSRIKETSSFL